MNLFIRRTAVVQHPLRAEKVGTELAHLVYGLGVSPPLSLCRQASGKAGVGPSRTTSPQPESRGEASPARSPPASSASTACTGTFENCKSEKNTTLHWMPYDAIRF